jgi:hypothetical protein
MTQPAADDIGDIVTTHEITYRGRTVRASTDGTVWILQGGPVDAVAGFANLAAGPPFQTWTWPAYDGDDGAKAAAVEMLGALADFADRTAALDPTAPEPTPDVSGG